MMETISILVHTAFTLCDAISHRGFSKSLSRAEGKPWRRERLYFSSSITSFPLCLVPQEGHKISISS